LNALKKKKKERKEILPWLGEHEIYVVVQFYPWFNFYFPLFFFMLIHDNEYETENKN